MLIFGKALTAVGLLIVACTLMIVSTVDHQPVLSRWSILTAMFGCTMALALVIDIVVRNAIREERVRTEKVIESVAAEFADREQRHLRHVPHTDRH